MPLIKIIGNTKFFGNVVVPPPNTSITQIGQDIDGIITNEAIGYSVAINSTGNRFITGTGKGKAKVYSNNGSSWVQLGSDIAFGIPSGFNSEQAGYAVSMNNTGDRVAISANFSDSNGIDAGRVKIYSWNGTAWNQLGGDIVGELANDLSGSSVSMNAAGDRVAIGATGNDGGGNLSGHVRVWAWNGTSWYKIGQDLDGRRQMSWFGFDVSMNAAGDRLVAAAPITSYVRAYSFNGSSWVQLGNDINVGCQSVSMNSDGNIFAVYGGNTTIIYYWNGIDWIQRGSDILGEQGQSTVGKGAISLNDVGDRIAIGNSVNDGVNGVDSGHTRIFSWNGTAWTQIGQDIDGEFAGDYAGYAVSMNSAGTVVAIGAYYNDPPNLPNAGHVRVYAIQ